MASDQSTTAACDEPLLDAARQVAAAAAKAGDQIEQDRRLPTALVDAMVDAGMFRMLIPESLGGRGSDLATYLRVIEEVAKADASTAWCLSQGATSAMIAGQIHAPAARHIFAEASTILAWGPGTGQAVPVEGGYLVTAKAAFASGCHHATWLGASATVVERDGTPAFNAAGEPDMRMFLVRPSEVTFKDVWRVSGLRGTGSDSYAITGVVVPEPQAVVFGSRREPGRVYAFKTVHVYALSFAVVALGIARGALNAFLALAAAKTARTATSVLRDNAVIQSQVARAEAGVASARAYLLQAVGEAWAAAPESRGLPKDVRIQIRLAATHAIHAATHTVDIVYHAAGSNAVLNDNPFERRFRDVHAVTQQVQGSQSHFELVGQHLLGLEPVSQLL